MIATASINDEIAEMGNRFSEGRQPALDIARGLAVLCMMFEHFVPTDGDGSLFQSLFAGIAKFADGKSAPLFCMLVGIGVALQAQRTAYPTNYKGIAWVRSLTLGIFGIIMGITIWPTEILTPIALMTILLWTIPSRRTAILCAIIIFILVPFVGYIFSFYFKEDWLSDGTHQHELQFGWVTLRYFLLTGNYPLMPWFVFPLVGTIFGSIDWTKGDMAKRTFWVTLTAAVVIQVYATWAEINKERLPSILVSTWVPTSLPFILVGTSSALATISGLIWWQLSDQKLRRAFNQARLLGRTSLTHYLMHICLVYTALSYFYPDEDWSVRIGVLTFIAYVCIAIPLTSWWLERFPRGPVERLLSIGSGKMTAGN